jgi:dihydroorotate dehydrogenase (NAD+) catalytic subunit
MLHLGGIRFSSTWGASGVQGFYGEGYPYHRACNFFLGFNFGGMTFTAKTVTTEPRVGNMPMKEDGITPRELMPACIAVTPRSWFMGAAVNAVGLTNPGIRAVIGSGKWQVREEPFCISWAPVGSSPAEREAEAKAFVHALKVAMSPMFGGFKSPFAIQINLSCPNTKEVFDVVVEGLRWMEIFAELGVPLIPKVNALESVATILKIADHPACAAVTTSNTLAWLLLSEADRRRYFGTIESPLRKRGLAVDGGVSGRPTFRPMIDQLKSLQANKLTKPVIAGGGILSPQDVREAYIAGASAIALGSVAFLRPWNVRRVIEMAQQESNLLRKVW